ncbi:FAD dependent oxidoreductase [Exophiala viscosa]|uniref:FAD dependent oxidoreductase n=1 Tax=Exophiala viscosa TaxID=2486360 RepID=UPI00219BE19C|nr:FAD dependent oxidoreductase [Exophiala viscosa]
MLSHDSKIIIVGGGVFGLSTGLWLARDGYDNITIFDRCPLDNGHYSPFAGCDGASADINKTFRTGYGKELHYQRLAIEARETWLAWNKEIKESTQAELPHGLTPNDKVLDLCGNIFLAEGPTLRDFYVDSLKSMETSAPEFRKLQFIKGNPDDEERLRKINPKWVEKLHALDGINNNDTNGFIDVQGGVTLADKACTYARFLCQKAGVKFVLDSPQGKLRELLVEENGSQRKVTGIKTCDGLDHLADRVIVACGGWTATIIPEAHRAIEATAGTVMFVDIPKDRKDLWERFDSKNFPVWSYRRGQGDEYYQGGGWPITRDGRLKFGFRGRKFTNFEDHPTASNLRVSTPRTKYTSEPITTVPLYGLKLVKEVIGKAFPELAEFGFTDTRLCWYTDSIDNDFLIDYVPGYSDSLFICTGGSGHAFKFLPLLGRHVKNQLERVPDEFTQLWKWRTVEEGKVCNGLEQGEFGPRAMSRLHMAEPRDFKFTRESTTTTPLQAQL